MSSQLHNARAVLFASAALVFVNPGAAFAQDTTDPNVTPPPVATPVAGKRVYTAADFARFAPRNALDMVRQVPGFTIREADQERGLGQASENVLLNGERVPSKSGGAIAELQKIPAANVERIEIVDAATLGIAGLSGQVANVIAKAVKKASGQFSWTPEFRAHFTDPIYTRGDVSYSGTAGKLEYTLGLNSGGGRSGAGGGTTIADASGNIFEFRDDRWRDNYDAPKLSARVTLDGPGSSVGNANVSYMFEREDYLEHSLRERPDGIDRERKTHFELDGWEFELGGDYAFDLAGGRIKLIGLHNLEDEPYVSTAITSFADGSPAIGDRVDREKGKSTETIARTEYGWKWGRSDFQLSAEGAFNKLDSVTRLFVLEPDGDFVEIPFPAGSGQVTEDRYEVMGTWGRPLSDNLTIQLDGGAEHSTLEAGGVVRKFFRPKGSASLAWKVDDNTDISLKLRRRVGQLNFFDFLASVSLTNDQENAGNINLVPPQSWEADFEVNRKLGDWGTTRLKLYGRMIDDIVDIIPIGEEGESLGNIDRATRYGVEWQSTFLFDPLGWKGAKLDSTVQFQRSRVEDPLTGEKRSISGDLLRSIELRLRHDIPGTDWAWSASLYHDWYAKNVRLTEIGRQWEGPLWIGAYVEHKDVFGLTVRATMSNIAGARSYWDRTVFDGRRTDPVLFVEDRDRLIGPIFSFSVRGNF